LDLDAALTLNQTTNTWSQTFTGTSGPGLTYTASGAVTSGTAAAQYINVSSSSTSVPGMVITNAGSGVAFRINDDGTTSDSTPFVVDASGNVGIGTASPTSALTIQGTGTSNWRGLVVQDNFTDGTDKGGVAIVGARKTNANTPFTGFATFDSGTGRHVYLGGGGWSMPDATSVRLFAAATYTETADTGSERLRIESNTTGVQVYGTHNTLGLKISNASLSGDKAWFFYPFTNGTDTDLRIYEYATSSSGDRFTFAAGGKLGIGDTSPGGKLEVDTDPGDNVIAGLITQDDTTNNNVALQIVNAGTGNGVFIDQNGNGIALNVDNAGTGVGINVVQTGDNDALRITSSATTTGNGINLAADSVTSSEVMDISGDGLTTGDGLHIQSTSSVFTSGNLLDSDYQVTGTALANRTGILNNFYVERNEGRNSGTTADNYDHVNIFRSQDYSGSGGAFTATGSVLYVENFTTGTITDTVKGIELVMDADGSGDSIFIDSNGTSTTSQIALNIDSESTTADVIALDGTLLTTGDGLSITVDNSMTTGKAFRILGGASGTTEVFNIDDDGNTSGTGQIDAGTTGDGLVTKVNAGACADTTFNLDTNGTLCVDSTNGRFYFRYGGAWHYAAQTAGFQIPAHETSGLAVGDIVVGKLDQNLEDGALHGKWIKLDLASRLNLDEIKDLTIQGTLSVFGKTAFASDVDVSGNISVGGAFSLSNQHAGFAVVPKGGRQVEVKFEKPFPQTPMITITSHAPPDVDWGIQDETKNGFTLKIEELASEDLTFSWLAVVVPGVKTTRGEVEEVPPVPTPEPEITETSAPTEIQDPSPSTPESSPSPINKPLEAPSSDANLPESPQPALAPSPTATIAPEQVIITSTPPSPTIEP
jgi:hypothetical protein